MRKTLLICLWLAPWISGVAKAETPETFSQWVSSRQLVVVRGIFGEFGLKKTNPTLDWLKKEFPGLVVTELKPSSGVSVTNNARERLVEIRQLYHKNGKRPLILLNHSKGGVESELAMMMDRASITKGRVEAIISVEAPFGGSMLADLSDALLDAHSPVDWLDPSRALARWAYAYLREGVRSIRKSELDWDKTNFWKDRIDALKADHYAALHERTFYVTSSEDPSKMTLFLRPLGALLERAPGGGPNDGAVLLRDQVIPGIGTVLSNERADHIGLMVEGPMSRLNQRTSLTSRQKFYLNTLYSAYLKRTGQN
jgi:hypothetical protein